MHPPAHPRIPAVVCARCRYEVEGVRRTVDAVLLVADHNHPHVLLLQVTRAGPQASHVSSSSRVSPTVWQQTSRYTTSQTQLYHTSTCTCMSWPTA